MLIGFVQGYEELKWGISKLNPLCNGPLMSLKVFQCYDQNVLSNLLKYSEG